jgi:hypothetical protein
MQHLGKKSLIGLTGAIIVGLAAAPQAVAQYIPEAARGWLQVGAFVVGLIAAYRHPSGQAQDYLSKRWKRGAAVLLIAALALPLAGCKTATPRHDATSSLGVLVTAASGLQNGEAVLYASAKLTAEQHAAFKAMMLKLWTAADSAVTIVEAWTPGASTPENLAAELQTIAVLLQSDAATVSATAKALSVDKSLSWLTTLLELVVAGKEAVSQIGELIAQNRGGSSDAETLAADNAVLATLHTQIATMRAALE